jgi:hypothetical protein
MRRYYDAHLYLANWGTHRIMLRLPRVLLSPKDAGQYCVDGHVSMSVTSESVILDLASEDETAGRAHRPGGKGQGPVVPRGFEKRQEVDPAWPPVQVTHLIAAEAS